MTWDRYHSKEDMEAYMDYLEDTYPDKISIVVIGKSYEGRDMRVLKVICIGKCCKGPVKIKFARYVYK